MMSRQTAPGVPGSAPLPNAGNPGTVYKANAMHPAAAAGMGLRPGQNPLNMRPGSMPGKR